MVRSKNQTFIQQDITHFYIELYIFNGKKATEYPISSYSEFERTPLNELTEYEIVECFQVSPIILDREITKDYNKKEKLEFVLTAYENQYYNVYIFVNPLNNTSLYDDLKKYNIQFNIYQREHYEIVIAAEIKIGIKNTAICNFFRCILRLIKIMV